MTARRPAPVALDIETTCLGHARNRARLLSLATPAGTYFIDLFRVDPAPLWPARAAEVVGHNLGFDLPFLMWLRFVPGLVRDTMLARQVLHAGDWAIGHALTELAHQHLRVTLDKELHADWSGPLSPATPRCRC